MIKKIIYILGLVGTIVLLFKFCDFKKSDDATTIDGAGLIQQQILNVGKLIVTEGHFSKRTVINRQLSCHGRLLVRLNTRD
jgi:hypothetical protein